MKTDRGLLTTLPIWIRLPGLSFNLWDPKAIGALVSAIGTPIKLDELTYNRKRTAFARVLVEMNAEFGLPKEVHALDEQGNVYSQVIEYENYPLLCVNCKCFGHLNLQCPFSKRLSPKNNLNNHSGINEKNVSDAPCSQHVNEKNVNVNVSVDNELSVSGKFVNDKNVNVNVVPISLGFGKGSLSVCLPNYVVDEIVLSPSIQLGNNVEHVDVDLVLHDESDIEKSLVADQLQQFRKVNVPPIQQEFGIISNVEALERHVAMSADGLTPSPVFMVQQPLSKEPVDPIHDDQFRLVNFDNVGVEEDGRRVVLNANDDRSIHLIDSTIEELLTAKHNIFNNAINLQASNEFSSTSQSPSVEELVIAKKNLTHQCFTASVSMVNKDFVSDKVEDVSNLDNLCMDRSLVVQNQDSLFLGSDFPSLSDTNNQDSRVVKKKFGKSKRDMMKIPAWLELNKFCLEAENSDRAPVRSSRSALARNSQN